MGSCTKRATHRHSFQHQVRQIEELQIKKVDVDNKTPILSQTTVSSPPGEGADGSS